jgi:transcriptional regulator with XRE-family HTH domain
MPGRIIKQLREERQITQIDMAELLFMSQSNYSKIENNKVALTAELSKRIVKILKVNLEDILPDDAILESPLLVAEKKMNDDVIAKIDQLITNKLDDFKSWMQYNIYPANHTGV